MKQINLLWILVGLSGLWALTHKLSGSHVAAAASVLLSHIFLYSWPFDVNNLTTEIPGAALLTWAALAFVWCAEYRKVRYFFMAGAILGLLTLTKGVFYYVTLGMVFPLAWGYLLSVRRDVGPRTPLIAGIVLVTAFAAFVGPWMIRNRVHFGRYEITQRGGVVLLTRAYKNQMTKEEVIGAIHLWGPGIYKRVVRDTSLDVHTDDYAIDGKLRRLDRSHTSQFHVADRQAVAAGEPDRAVSFYARAGAERTRARRNFAACGGGNPDHAADTQLRRDALRLILDRPCRHLAMSTLFAWRGFWCFRVPGWPGGGRFEWQRSSVYESLTECLVNLLNLAAGLCLLGQTVTGLNIRKKRGRVAMSFVPLSMLTFHALFTHNIPRYSLAAIPLMLCSLTVLAWEVGQSIWRKLLANRGCNWS